MISKSRREELGGFANNGFVQKSPQTFQDAVKKHQSPPTNPSLYKKVQHNMESSTTFSTSNREQQPSTSASITSSNDDLNALINMISAQMEGRNTGHFAQPQPSTSAVAFSAEEEEEETDSAYQTNTSAYDRKTKMARDIAFQCFLDEASVAGIDVLQVVGLRSFRVLFLYTYIKLLYIYSSFSGPCARTR
jgi:hypothetical protein